MSIDLPHCDELFLRYFDRWYDEEDRTRRGFQATRPDLVTLDELIGKEPRDFATLTEEGCDQVLARIVRMTDAARSDWSHLLPDSGEMDQRWLSAIDAYYDRERIHHLIEESDPSDYSNDYLVTCCEFGAVLGHVLQAALPRLEWDFGWPYWESALFDPETGSVIPVFHWAVKKMSDYGVDDGYAEKIEVCVRVLDRERISRN